MLERVEEAEKRWMVMGRRRFTSVKEGDVELKSNMKFRMSRREKRALRKATLYTAGMELQDWRISTASRSLKLRMVEEEVEELMLYSSEPVAT